MPQTFPSKYQGSYETATIPRTLKTFLFSSQLFLSAAQFSEKLNYKGLGLGNLREYAASHSAGVPVWSGVKIHIHAIILKNLTSWFSDSRSKILKLARARPDKGLSETAWRERVWKLLSADSSTKQFALHKSSFPGRGAHDKH